MATKSPSTNHDRKRRRFGQSADGGYSLPLVLVIAFVLIAGASALVARTGSGVFGSAFQKQSWEARSLAELGMATLVSRLNKEENRYLLAAPSNERVPSYDRNALWSSDSAVLAANHTNPCADTYIPSPTTGLQVKQPIPPEIGNIYPNKQRDGWWYVNSSGEVSTNATNAVGKFRLIDNPIQSPGANFRMGIVKYVNNGDVEEELNFSSPDGKSSIRLSVEAIALNADGSEKSRAVLEEVLDVVPKCCDTTFGGDHGNNNYTAAYDANNPFGAGSCLPPIKGDSFGLVFGIGGSGGRLETIGNATEVWKRAEDGSLTLINPVACIELTSSCTIDGTFNKIDGSNKSQLLEILNTRMPPAPEWYPGRQAGESMPTFLPLGASTANGLSVCSKPSGLDCLNLNNLPENLKDTAGPGGTSLNANPATTPFFRYCLDDKCTRTYINGNAADFLPQPSINPPPAILPPHCKRALPPPNGDGALHCVASKIDVGLGGNILQFVTGVESDTSADPIIRPIRVYFATASTVSGNQISYVINQTGGGIIEHCVVTTLNPDSDPNRCRGTNTSYKERVTQLSMFGCNPDSTYYGVPCGPQYISLQGNASTLGYFSYFPNGNIELQGTANIEGVIWSNNIYSGGSGDFIVPESGVLDVFELMGINPGPSNNCNGSIYGSCPEAWQPKWDFVARSARRFRFKFG